LNKKIVMRLNTIIDTNAFPPNNPFNASSLLRPNTVRRLLDKSRIPECFELSESSIVRIASWLLIELERSARDHQEHPGSLGNSKNLKDRNKSDAFNDPLPFQAQTELEELIDNRSHFPIGIEIEI